MKRRCNSAILPKIATLVGGTILGSLVYTTTALAAAFPPLIMEVQPIPADNPTQLVVHGRYFGLISVPLMLRGAGGRVAPDG